MQRPQNKPINHERQDTPDRKNMAKNGEFPSGNMQMSPANKLELIGLSESGSKLISSFESNNFRGSVSFEKDGNMWYEVVMPLSKLQSVKFNCRNGMYSFFLGFEYKGVSSNVPSGGPRGRPGGSSGPGPGRGSIGGGMQGGLGPGAGRPGGFSGRDVGFSPGSSSDTKTIFWLKNISLAVEN